MATSTTFGTDQNQLGTLNYTTSYTNTDGQAWVSFSVDGINSPMVVTFEGSGGNEVWTPIVFQNIDSLAYATSTSTDGNFQGSIDGLSVIRWRTSTAGRTPCTILGRTYSTPLVQDVSITQNGEVSTKNSTSTALIPADTWTGEWEDVSGFPSITVASKSDQDGTLYIQFSPDGTNADSSLSFVTTAGVNEVHRLSTTRRFFRVVYTNGAVQQGYFRLQSMKGAQFPLTSALNSTVQSDADSLVTRSILMGQQDNGNWEFVPVDDSSHLETSIHGPLLPFGSVHTEKLTPIFQADGVYQINPYLVETQTSGTGTATVVNSDLVVTTGATALSQGVIQSVKRLRYRAGQGVVLRFAGRFTTPVANSYQVVGIGHAEDGLYFGYVGTALGMLHVSRGVREVKTLTVTVGATVAGNVTITLNATPFTIAVTNAANIQRTVYEISRGTFTGWEAYPSGATVIFVRNASGVTAGTQSFAAGATGSTATIAQTKAGVAADEVFYPQTAWNGDRLLYSTDPNNSPSGVTLDPTKGNVYQLFIQYLGYGVFMGKMEVAPDDGNNAIFNTVNTFKFPNTRTQTTFGNPSFPFTMAAYSAGSTTNLTVSVGSFGGFIEGQKVLHGPRFSYYNQLTTVTDAAYRVLFSVLNTRYYAGRTNQSVINLLSISGAIKHNNPVIYYLVRNATLLGNPNFTSVSTYSTSLWDTAATTCTFTQDQVVWSGHVGDTGEIDHHFANGEYNAEELTIQPGEMYTLCARSTSANPSMVTGSLNTREDQ